MNKKELIRTISQELNSSMSQDKITLVLDKAVEITKRTLATGEPVKWSGFGSFVMKDVPPRLFYSTRMEKYATSKGYKRITFVPSRTK
ncbi:hypothetical protein CE91St24_31820 [Odoribacteraceae bacterium]|nr:hypothetical protein CE91St21_09060 [Odoribacteraceae bacterium]GKH92410.1 hypothetical protein CE91St23_09060 [Odoribacteraceae bacterium]GKH97028.1 hypothetical protein CE91St22_09060 [Odoribacteraceae bacterium]GKI03907.1 hypothetical protein CE91St24_31820 [Odoribacteraceae bacterium]